MATGRRQAITRLNKTPGEPGLARAGHQPLHSRPYDHLIYPLLFTIYAVGNGDEGIWGIRP